jgi:hypothetical protein
MASREIIQYSGPATWAEDRSGGYCTPMYMFNCIIRLQAIVKIITNETARALNLLANKALRCAMPSIRTAWL